MAFLDLVKQRYSCRSYQPTSVEKEKLDYIMECVRFAPSAVNKQPWMFRIISSEADRKKICQCYNREWFATAPVVVIASILHDEEWVRSDGKQLPSSIFVWRLQSRDLVHVGYVTLMLNYAKSPLVWVRMRKLPS